MLKPGLRHLLNMVIKSYLSKLYRTHILFVKIYVGCVSDSVTHQTLKNGALAFRVTHPTNT